MAEYEVRICSLCGYENAQSAVICTRCNAHLASVTTLAAPHESQQDSPRPLTTPIAPEAGYITIYIPGASAPLKTPTKRVITLGRSVSGQPNPDVDLNPYNAGMAGISRNHALLKMVDGGLMVEDVGSSNGTWLNENKLTPFAATHLSNGDVLRLGQLLLFVYFTPLNTTLHLRDYHGRFAEGVGVSIMPEVTAFLGAVECLQNILDQLADRPIKHVCLRSLEYDISKAYLTVKLKDANEALYILSEYFMMTQETAVLSSLYEDGGGGESNEDAEALQRQVEGRSQASQPEQTRLIPPSVQTLFFNHPELRRQFDDQINFILDGPFDLIFGV